MNWLSTLGGWARTVARAITGAGVDVAEGVVNAAAAVASTVTSIGQLTNGPLFTWAKNLLVNISVFKVGQDVISLALHRLPMWIWLVWGRPYYLLLLGRINALAAWTAGQLLALTALVYRLNAATRAYAAQLVAAERTARIKAVQAEAAARIQGDKVTLATVQKQASSGYNTGDQTRQAIATTLLEDLTSDTPAVKDLVSAITGWAIDLAEVDDPLIRFALNKALSEVISKAGIDTAAADLVTSLLGAATSSAKATDLYSTEKDVASRLNALEGNWAQFMADGGSDVEDAGEQWQDLGSLSVSIALVASFALAVTDPSAWATGIADTAGPVIDGALTGIVDLINIV